MTNPTLWITRSRPGAEASAKSFAQDGFQTIIAPLLDIHPPETLPPRPENEALLVFTSKNGLRAFTALTEQRHWPVITVGDATAQMARSMGFQNVESASGTWVDIVKRIKHKAAKTRPIRHIGGNHVRGAIVDVLCEAGFDARRDVFYISEPVSQLPDMDVSKITHVALHAPLAARTLRRLAPDTSHMRAVSISPATDAELGSMAFQARWIAKSPDESAMRDAVRSGLGA